MIKSESISMFNVHATARFPAFLTDTFHRIFELVEVDYSVVVLVVFRHEGVHQFLVAGEVLVVGLQDKLELLSLDFAVPIEVEGVESKSHIVVIGHDGLVHAHGNELIVIDFSVPVSVDGQHQLLEVGHRHVFALFRL